MSVNAKSSHKKRSGTMTAQEMAKMVEEALKAYKSDPKKHESYIEWKLGGGSGTYADYRKATS